MEKNPKSEEFLECKLTPPELMEKGRLLSQENQKSSRLEDEKKSVMSNFKAKIDACDAEIGVLSQAISTGIEMRNVKCETRYNAPESGMKTLFRLDVNESAKISNMSANELQDLFINGLGDMETEFVFKDMQAFSIVNRDDLKENEKGWDSAGDVSEAKDLITFKRKKDSEYRVIRGEWDGVTKYQLQIKNGEKAK